MRILSIIFLSVCLFACKQGKKEMVTENLITIDSLKVTKDDISKLNYVEFILDGKAYNLFGSWASYDELDNHITNLKQGDLSFFKENPELLDAFVKDLKETIPENAKTPAIEARVKELETKIYKLQSFLNLSNTNKNKLLPAIQELLVSFSNLNLQINKKIEKESQIIEKP